MTSEPLVQELWAPFIAGLPIDGASISVISRAGIGSTVSTSDETATRLDSLQAELGEGPRWAAFTTGAPVLVPDTRSQSAHVAWPLFGVALAALPVRAVFSFPLIIGVLVVGVADLYSTLEHRPWSPRQLADAEGIAAASAGPAVRLATRSAASERTVLPRDAAELRREIHQATGMLVVHLDVGPEEALARLEGHAFATGRPLLDVARDIVSRRLDLRTDQG